MNKNYYKHFMKFWFPIYEKQVIKAKEKNDNDTLQAIYKNIKLNWNLKKEKEIILKKLGLKEKAISVDTLKSYYERWKKTKNY